MAAGMVSNKEIYGARVSGKPQFYPGYTKQDGTKVSERCVVPILVNIPGRKDPNTGQRSDGTLERYYITAWGNAAHDFAKNCAMGKELAYVELRQSQYRGTIYVNGQPVLDNNGQPVTQTKTSHSVVNYRWGDDSAKTIDREIQNSLRPIGWDGNIPVSMLLAALHSSGPNGVTHLIQQAQHGQEQWKQMLEARRNYQYQPGMKTYAFADVVESGSQSAPAAPQGQGAYTGTVANATQGQAPGNAAQYNQAPPNPNTAPVDPFTGAPATNQSGQGAQSAPADPFTGGNQNAQGGQQQMDVNNAI